MFSRPWLQPNTSYPSLPNSPEWFDLLKTLGVVIDPNFADDTLTQISRYAVGWVEHLEEYYKPGYELPVLDSPLLPILRKAGLIDRIDPKSDTDFDYILIDGGNITRYRDRLAYLEELRKEGYKLASTIIVYGGQSLRALDLKEGAQLVEMATRMVDRVDDWARTWIEEELVKKEDVANIWDRPFATEREIGLLCLLEQYGQELHHVQQRTRENPHSIDPSIPVAEIAADDFSLHNQRITLLNSPARIREHAGRRLPLEFARPTGRSCLYEWILLDKPPENSSVLFLKQAPDIYRSWFDMILRANEAGRHDLKIVAAGSTLIEDATVADILEGLGNLIINFYNLIIEGGVSSGAPEPIGMSAAIGKSA